MHMKDPLLEKVKELVNGLHVQIKAVQEDLAEIREDVRAIKDVATHPPVHIDLGGKKIGGITRKRQRELIENVDKTGEILSELFKPKSEDDDEKT